MNTVVETWLPVIGYEELYTISNFGNIRSIHYKGGNIIKILKPQLNKRLGYLYINLWKNNERKGKRLHKLVAEAFILNPEKKGDVNHINGIKTDNRVENLEWNTRSENMIHARKNNLLDYTISHSHRNKITKKLREKYGKTVQQFDKRGILIAEFDSAESAAKSVCGSQPNITNCCLNKPHYKTVKGFIFKYKD